MVSLLLAGGGRAQQTPPAVSPEDKRPPDARALFAAFARMPGLEARYAEKKHLSLLAVPLESRGRMYFLQPGYLSRVVEAPEKSTLTITPQKLRMTGRDGVEVIDLNKSDRLRLFVTSIVRVFRGDREPLEKLYRVRYEPSEKNDRDWSLRLLPRQKPLDQMMKALTLRGSGLAVSEIVLVEPNGDRTVTTITVVDPKRVFDAAEKEELFGIRRKAASGKAR